MALSASAIQARLITACLPTFPRTASKLDHLISVAEAPANVIASVIATDPAITALVIGQANASGHETTQLTEAIRRTGMGVVLTTAQTAVPVAENQRKAIASCWAQANAVATMMPILYDYRSYQLKHKFDNETLHVAGLVHDLGHVLAVTQFTPEYERAYQRLEEGEDDLDRLLGEEIGAMAADLAAIAAKNWSLPKLLTAAMTSWRAPHAADAQFAELCALLHTSHVLVQAAGFTAAADRFVMPTDDWALSTLNLRLPDMETVLGRMFDSMDELELYEGALGG